MERFKRNDRGYGASWRPRLDVRAMRSRLGRYISGLHVPFMAFFLYQICRRRIQCLENRVMDWTGYYHIPLSAPSSVRYSYHTHPEYDGLLEAAVAKHVKKVAAAPRGQHPRESIMSQNGIACRLPI